MLATLGISTSALADDLLEAMDSDGGYKTLLQGIKTAGLEDAFKGQGPITVFAPTDVAFAALPKAQLKKLMSDKEELKKVISYHIVPNKITKADVDAGKVKSLEGDSLTISVAGGAKVNNVPMLGDGTHADNGVIHAINTVLMPKS